MTFPARNVLLAFAVTAFGSCAVQHQAPQNTGDTLNDYLSRMSGKSHRMFLEDAKAGEDLAHNAATFKLDKKDKTKNAYMDKYGAYVSIRDAKLIYDADHDLTFQVYVRNAPVDKQTYGFARTAPVLFLDQANDGKTESVFDRRFAQVMRQHADDTTEPAAKDQAARFELDENGDVVEHITLSEALAVRYDLIYDLTNEKIDGRCPGARFKQSVTDLTDANPVLQASFKNALDWKLKQQESKQAIRLKND